MLVDYQKSNCEVYQELLLIPGKFAFDNKDYYSIIGIMISMEVSVENRRNN